MDAVIPLCADDGTRGKLIITNLPGRPAPEHDAERNVVFLREAQSYRFTIECDIEIDELQPEELFDVDDRTSRTGRLNPAESVGLVEIAATLLSGKRLDGVVDVRAAKFDDERAFSTMLSDLAARSVDVLHQGFAPSAGTYRPATELPAALLYQRFAVLSALLKGTDLSWALGHVIARPHRSWETEFEPRRPGQPMPGSSRLSTQLSRPGRRVPSSLGPLPSLPASLLVQRTIETLDTVPNRYVRFVFERWRALAAEVAARAGDLRGSARRRGINEAELIVRQLDEVLSSPLFREVGPLAALPGDNQVLRRREGYRQILGAAVLVESSLGLDLHGIDDPFLVSRRSIATLYEYWVFVQLADAVASVWSQTGPNRNLFKINESGMSLVLRADGPTRLKFETKINEQLMRAELFFNRSFGAGSSWTRPMRPDASLVIMPADRDEVWLHFDAKYKVDWDHPFETGTAEAEEDAERRGVSKRTDLLKMHAYRDAIRASAGSYVLFPGSEQAEFAVSDTEFLPGLGAFPLRPGQASKDIERLHRFLDRALTHVASTGTRHRRAAYWTTRAYDERGTESVRAAPPVGELPPADTPVLIGYVRSAEQWAWVRANGLYNIRSGDRRGAVSADAQALDAQMILLYGFVNGVERQLLGRRMGAWQAASSQALLRLGYPRPRGSTYLLCSLEALPLPEWMTAVNIRSLRPKSTLVGQPFSVSWLDLALSIHD